jgi:hypothetical protein
MVLAAKRSDKTNGTAIRKYAELATTESDSVQPKYDANE